MYYRGNSKEITGGKEMLVIFAIVLGLWMIILPLIKVITLDDIIASCGAICILLGLFGWVLARHIEKE